MAHDFFISPSEQETCVPVAIRLDLVVKIIGIPSDLTRQEADKIARVLMALGREGPRGSARETLGRGSSPNGRDPQGLGERSE